MWNKIQKEKLKKRNEEIYYLHEVKGITLRRIAEMYELSYERVRQIIEKQKVIHSQRA